MSLRRADRLLRRVADGILGHDAEHAGKDKGNAAMRFLIMDGNSS
jgi:hypothetical protein